MKKIGADYIGPPDPVSNLRPIAFYKPKNESGLEKKYRETREETQDWNQNFWTKHNNSFAQVCGIKNERTFIFIDGKLNWNLFFRKEVNFEKTCKTKG